MHSSSNLRHLRPRIVCGKTPRADYDSIMPLTLGTLFRLLVLAILAMHVFAMYCLARTWGGQFGFHAGQTILAAVFALIMLVPLLWAVTVPEWQGFSFIRNGSILYRGEISVTGGQFTARVPVPKDVTFGSRARLSLYALGGETDAVGTTEQLTIFGTDSTVAPDTTGPEITIRLHSREFSPGDIVPPDPELMVDLTDESGINTSSVSIGHQLEAVLSSNGRLINLSDAYSGNLDTYQSGRATTTLRDLPEGRQSVRVRAWDIHNNSSVAEAAFEVRNGGDANVFRVVNYPNPFARSTIFTMQRTSAVPVDIRIRVYTVAGRMIRELETPGVTELFVRVPWDGRDSEGNEVANGVYLYKVITRTMDGGETKEVIEKLAVMR